MKPPVNTSKRQPESETGSQRAGPDTKKALVVGGGIAGVQAALDLADSGVEVFLVEREPSIGGRMAQLDKTFPTNDCAMCILSPKLVEAGSHPYLRIITNARVESVEGDAPDFRVRVIKKPRYVDEEKCTGCGVCMAKCPVKIPDEYNEGLGKTRCIRIPFPQAVPAVAIIEAKSCIFLQRGKCRICEKSCDAKAIDFNQQEERLDLEVGSIILAAGLVEFNAVLKDEYGYRTFPNVVTSIELERILGASGPTKGHVLRPSDGKEPRKIGFIQCVGSRDALVGNEYCSAFCCMQAAKDAVILGEHVRGVETAVFGMDVRAFGKNFDRFIERAEKVNHTRFVRARISSVEIDPASDDLVIQYSEDGRVRRERFDLLVLSVGLQSTPGLRDLAARLGVEVDRFGFVRTAPFTPVSTSRPGIFVCGSTSGPEDIPESVIEASGAASAAGVVLSRLPSRKITVEYPPETSVNDSDRPRVGVFVCHCGINIAATVNVKEVVAQIGALPYVALCEDMIFTCSQDAQKTIRDKVNELKLNRVVIAACTPRTHEPLFQNTLRNAGLNPYLFEFANIREQCSWVHQQEPEKATEKATEIIRMAVARVLYQEPLKKTRVRVTRRCLVIGGGLAGMTAALDIAGQGYPVSLVERETELGGNLRYIPDTLEGEPVPPLLQSLTERVTNHPDIEVFTGAVIEGVHGYVGNFRTRINVSWTNKTEVEHGVIVLATGAREHNPDEYLYGRDERVITQRQLAARLANPKVLLDQVKSVVMIQCVGSRDDRNPNCSRVCCSTAIKHALRLKALSPRIKVFVLYRDIRSYGLRELYYTKAREAGVIFIRHTRNDPPAVTTDEHGLAVVVEERHANRSIRLRPDLLVLSTGIVPNQENKALSQFLKVPLGQDGFFLEAHVKLRPVDFATDGIFVCGLAHYPKHIRESIAQAKAAASRAVTILSRDEIEAGGKVSFVIENRCTGCGVCVEVCPYRAIELNRETDVAVVNEALCEGCGTCAASCRSGAMNLRGVRDEQILAALDAL